VLPLKEWTEKIWLAPMGPSLAADMGISLSSVIGAVLSALGFLASVLSDLGLLTVIAAFAVVAWATRDAWARKCWQATLGELSCPDPRNWILCGCLPCGWCIMNVCCSWICPRFHPPFRLRIIIVKAKHLQESVLGDLGAGGMAVYAEVRAGNNPVKTTSVQAYNRFETSTVLWNEPIDMVMYPATTTVSIALYHTGTDDIWLGSLHIPVDAFYEPPGSCSEWTICGHSGARLCSELLGAEYRWPFVRGAPSTSEWRLQSRQGGCCRHREECERWEVLHDIGHTVLLPVASPRSNDMRTWSGLSGHKFEAIQDVTNSGMRLRELPDVLRADKDVVLAAVRQNAGALQFAAPSLQHDPMVRQAAADAPEPAILKLERGDEDAGKLWVYFILHGMGQDEDLPQKMMAV